MKAEAEPEPEPVAYPCSKIETEVKIEAAPSYITKTVVKKVPVELRQFESGQELKDWMCGRLYFSLEGQDCDDAVFQLIKDARRDGYDISFTLIEAPGWVGNRWINDRTHMLGATVINGKVWLIDTTHNEITEWYSLD